MWRTVVSILVSAPKWHPIAWAFAVTPRRWLDQVLISLLCNLFFLTWFTSAIPNWVFWSPKLLSWTRASGWRIWINWRNCYPTQKTRLSAQNGPLSSKGTRNVWLATFKQPWVSLSIRTRCSTFKSRWDPRHYRPIGVGVYFVTAVTRVQGKLSLLLLPQSPKYVLQRQTMNILGVIHVSPIYWKFMKGHCLKPCRDI